MSVFLSKEQSLLIFSLVTNAILRFKRIHYSAFRIPHSKLKTFLFRYL